MKAYHSSFFLKCFILTLTIVQLASCGGGGGGGDDFIGAATVTLQVSPTTIDTGDRMLIRTDISEVNDSGIALKFKFPVGLKYVTSSSSLTTDNKSFDISPLYNVEEGNFRYLVYFISQASFGENLRGTTEFLLEGIDKVLQGEVQVDVDVDNPLINNDVEFDPKTPEFSEEDFVEVKVE